MLSRGPDTLGAIYQKHPGVADQLAAQEHWEAGRKDVLERFYSKYTLGSLFRLVVDELLELIVDAKGNQPRELVLLEAADVNAITSKLMLHISRQMGQRVDFEDRRVSLEEIHFRAAINERVLYKGGLSEEERAALEITAQEFLQQLIETCSYLSGSWTRKTRKNSREAVNFIQRVLDPRITPNSILTNSKTGDTMLSPKAERAIQICLESTVPDLYRGADLQLLDREVLVDLFDCLRNFDCYFPESDPNEIGVGYYLEGHVTYKDADGVHCALRRGKNARHIRENTKDIRAVKAMRNDFPLHMIPDEGSLYGAKQMYLAVECRDPKNSEARAAYSRSELFRKTQKTGNIELLGVTLR